MAELKLVSFDWAIKRLLRSKANFGVLEGFLSELLRDDITSRRFWKAVAMQPTRTTRPTGSICWRRISSIATS